MVKDMIKMEYIEEYVTLARTLNFSRTAERHYITQPALSRHIQLIEEEMGAVLLTRTTRSTELTPAGEAVYECFRSMLTLYSTARKQAQELSVSDNGIITINSPYYWTADHTEPLLSAFSVEYPMCGISILPCQPVDGLKGLIDKKCDLYVSMHMQGLPDDIDRISFGNEEDYVFMMSDHELAGKECIDYADFDGRTLVYNKGFEEARDQLLSWFWGMGIVPSDIVCCKQIEELGMVLRQTGGLCICPYGVRHMDRPYIVQIPFRERMIEKMYLYYRKDTQNPMVKRFLETVKQK